VRSISFRGTQRLRTDRRGRKLLRGDVFPGLRHDERLKLVQGVYGRPEGDQAQSQKKWRANLKQVFESKGIT
jgi:hypothetical protein